MAKKGKEAARDALLGVGRRRLLLDHTLSHCLRLLWESFGSRVELESLAVGKTSFVVLYVGCRWMLLCARVTVVLLV